LQNAIFQIFFSKNADFRKKRQFSRKTPIFAKKPYGSGKIAKIGKKSFSQNPIFAI
jgi:hypothetical protein